MNGGGIFAIILVLGLLLAFGGYTLYVRVRARRLGLPPPPLNPFAHSTSSSDYAAPSPAPHNPISWLQSKFAAFRNPRTAGGAYESTSRGGGGGTSFPSGGGRGGGGGGGRRGFGPLDPDEAWDSRVENEIGGGYYEGEDLELGGGHHSAAGPYGGSGYGGGGGYVDIHSGGAGGRGRSRSRQRELDHRYDVETGRAGSSSHNPFGDEAAVEAASLRGLSPRPLGGGEDTEYRGVGAAQGKGRGKGHHGKKESLDDSPTERRSMFTEDV